MKNGVPVAAFAAPRLPFATMLTPAQKDRLIAMRKLARDRVLKDKRPALRLELLRMPTSRGR